MNEHPEAINHISENFKQLIHDFCNMEETPLDLDFAEFNNCISAVERSCDLAYNIVRKAYKQAEADKGFKEPVIKPDDTKGMNKSWIVSNHKSFATSGKGSDLKNQVAADIKNVTGIDVTGGIDINDPRN